MTCGTSVAAGRARFPTETRATRASARADSKLSVSCSAAAGGSRTLRCLQPGDAAQAQPQPVDDDIQSTPDIYVRSTLHTDQCVTLGQKYAANVYQLKYTVADDHASRPIISIDDLKTFNVPQSEFTELKALGDVQQQYPSISRLYLGVLSRTIIAVPARYVILRQKDGCAAVCRALVDSSSMGGCKFQFQFLLTPDISPIDLLQLSQALAANAQLKDCSVRPPDFLKEGAKSGLTSAFISSFDYDNGSSQPHTFLLTAEIRDDGSTPAVANANLFIKQLCTVHEPFLSGVISIKLDDAYPTAIDVPVMLSFKNTGGTSDGLDYHLDEASPSIALTNGSIYDLSLQRYAVCSPQAIQVTPLQQTLIAGKDFSITVPAEHADLSLAVDCELAVGDSIPKADLGRYLQFQTQDVQNTQYALGVNAGQRQFRRARHCQDRCAGCTDGPAADDAESNSGNRAKARQHPRAIADRLRHQPIGCDACLHRALHGRGASRRHIYAAERFHRRTDLRSAQCGKRRPRPQLSMRAKVRSRALAAKRNLRRRRIPRAPCVARTD
jgi:hypothetical protein